MSDVTMRWMEHMISCKFPPLTPHHTQALVVMMMSRFFGTFLHSGGEGLDKGSKLGMFGKRSSSGKLNLKAFIAQMATVSGKRRQMLCQGKRSFHQGCLAFAHLHNPISVVRGRASRL